MSQHIAKHHTYMETPFAYDRFVTGKNFIGRKPECTALQNLLEKFENVCMYEPPKTGKMSVIQQSVFNMRVSGKHFGSMQVSIFNIRSLGQFLLKFGSSVIRSFASTPQEYEMTVSTMLEGTSFSFNSEKFSEKDEVLTLDKAPDENDIRAVLALPGKIAAYRNMPVYIIIEEFQALLKLDEMTYETVFRILNETMAGRDPGNPGFAYILTGSKINAMKFIFEERKYFHRNIEHIKLHEIDAREIIEHIVKGFLSSGKVIERDLVLGATKLFRCNIWYLNHFTSICDSLSKGFINEGVLMEALRIIISIHEPKFSAIADDLTDHQMNFMRAILDGEKKFSSSDVIEKYGFNSSANVRRIKDALKKKEIITFNEDDEAVILDPLFEYWLGQHYFI